MVLATHAPTKDTCTSVTCDANKFDTNSDATDRCKDNSPVVVGGMCDTWFVTSKFFVVELFYFLSFST